MPSSRLLPASVALAQPAPHGPDFLGARDARWLDRSLAASDASAPIEPSDIIFFGLDRTALDDAAMSQLDVAAMWLRAHPDHRLVLEGYTDIIGSTDYNADLGRRRVERVRRYLVQRGVDTDRIMLVVMGSMGANRIEDPNDRRVVMFASPLPIRVLATAELDSKRPLTVAWTDRGSRLEEQKGLGGSETAVARR